MNRKIGEKSRQIRSDKPAIIEPQSIIPLRQQGSADKIISFQ